MSRFFFTLSLLLWSHFSFSQKAYFQQHVDYTIDVTLDDQNHILRGFETLIYKNNSKDTLRSIYFHVWANAFKNDQSSYTEQNVENGETDFYFSEEADRGYIDSLNFKINNETVITSNFNNHEDIILLDLNNPLLPNQSIEITTPFRLKIPKTFSRLGHNEQAYQISQWYPKPAVYDPTGWHPLPYLDQGEFYSEFGNYHVRITLPTNYIVAATGDLQEESEKEFITSKIKTEKPNVLTKETIQSSTTFKTISFKQSNVHDFAWFANKNFQIEKTEITLASGNKVACYSYFKPSNFEVYKGSCQIIAKTITYLSEHVGEYPYQHASIVDGTLVAGGGMEYPNITVIGSVNSASMLETVIIHEVGHNWFYGILGSNEREYPWMDESINSFYENEIHEEISNESNSRKKLKGADKLNHKLNDIFVYQLGGKSNTDQALNLPSTSFTSLNYGGIVYQKGPKLLSYLKKYMGETKFENAMKKYFSLWHLKHPSPLDFQKIMQEESDKDISWFFEDGLGSDKKIDFAITTVNKKDNTIYVKAKSKTAFNGPIPIDACIGDSIIQTQWIEYPYAAPAIFNSLPDGITAYKIDAKSSLPEIKISNNQYKTYGVFHKFQPAIKLGTGIGISTKNEVYLLPAAGYNYYDKFMLGGVIHNLKIPNNKFQFALAPMYSFGSKKLVGSGFIGYTIFPNKIAQSIILGIQGRSYHHNESHLNISNSIYLRHIKLLPSLNIDFKKKTARSTVSNQLALRYYIILNESFKYNLNVTDSLYQPSVDKAKVQQFGSIGFLHKNARTFNPYSYQVSMLGNNNFMKASVQANIRIDYYKKGKAFYARFFAGKFFDFQNSTNVFELQNQYLNTTSTARNDFTYDEVFFARNEQKGFLTQQISTREGGFKIQTNLLSNPIGQNNNWITAINLRSDLPIKLPLKIQVFLDAGTYANAA
ncbi:MAG TPA: M1 family metallopeptidase, partial [Chitinophagaceae bacterium]|nr:M1 family metallopeptidase [Chitinophagaceae bacterium]